MCGDFDDHDQVDEELFERFVALADHFGVSANAPGASTPTKLDQENERAAYMEDLFRSGLTRSLSDASNLPTGERMDALAGQAIVFARLAGFLAGQFPPQSDLFRMITAALLEGHKEPSSLPVS